MKKVLKKILKCLLVVLIFCIVYYIICLIRSSILVKDLAKALERDYTRDIERLTGENFFADNMPFADFKNEFVNGYEYIRGNNKNFSYNYIGMKPYYNYILFEYEISYPDPEWIASNGQNTKEVLANIDETILDTKRKDEILINYFEETVNYRFPVFLGLTENYDLINEENLDYVLVASNAINFKNIMNAVKQDIEIAENPQLKKAKAILGYNIFTNKFTTDGIFYYAARGFSSAHDTVLKFNEAYWNAFNYNNLNREYMWLYNNNGDILTCLFLKDDLIWLEENTQNNKIIEDKNIYFIRNNIKKDEIIQSLGEEGYFASDEELLFIKENENNIIVALRNNKFLWTDYEEKREYFLENNLSKEEIIEYLNNEGFVLENNN